MIDGGERTTKSLPFRQAKSTQPTMTSTPSAICRKLSRSVCRLSSAFTNSCRKGVKKLNGFNDAAAAKQEIKAAWMPGEKNR
jgi:hypothetical protein